MFGCAGAGTFEKDGVDARSIDFVSGCGFVFGNERWYDGFFTGGGCSNTSFIGWMLAGIWMEMGLLFALEARSIGAAVLATIDGVSRTLVSNCSCGTNLVLAAYDCGGGEFAFSSWSAIPMKV